MKLPEAMLLSLHPEQAWVKRDFIGMEMLTILLQRKAGIVILPPEMNLTLNYTIICKENSGM